MLDSKFNQDDIDWISETYRKYALGITYHKESFYILDGHDMTTKDYEENYMVDQAHRIYAFRSIEQLRSFILTQKPLAFDQERLLLWAKHHKKTEAYSQFNFDEVRRLISGYIKLSELTKEQALEILNLINLFDDYALQRERAKGDRTLVVLRQEKEVDTFFDYAYNNYIWENPEYAGYRSLNELDYLRFDEEKFRENIQEMLKLFVDNTVVWEGN